MDILIVLFRTNDKEVRREISHLAELGLQELPAVHHGTLHKEGRTERPSDRRA